MGSETYAKQGVSVARSLLDSDMLELLRAALDFAETHPSPMASNLASSDDAFFFNDFNTWRKNPFIGELITAPFMRRAANEVVGTCAVRLFHDHILVKKGMSPATPWHQDRPYYFVQGPMNYSVWMSPEGVSASEGLAFLAGSHLLPRMFVPVNFRDGTAMEPPAGMDVLDDEMLNALRHEYPEVAFDLDPGDALIFDNRILHMARRSSEPIGRRALSIRYLGDGSLMTWNGVNQTPPFHRMGMKFEEGDNPPEAWFPTIWSE